MAPVTRGLFRTVILSCFIITLITVFCFYRDRVGEYTCNVRNQALYAQRVLSSQKATTLTGTKAIHQRLNLEESECRTTFPGLLSDIDASVARGPFAFTSSPPDYKGLVQGRIIDGNLYILSTAADTPPQTLHQRTSTLSQIHRALITTPTPLPNTYFAFCINDVPKNNSWAFSRPNKPNSTYNTWLMPLFSGWSWPQSHLGTMDEILERIDAVESNVSWEEKEDRVVWRGTPWFNPLGYLSLRKDLLQMTKSKEWADVQALDSGNVTNALNIEDFCRYKYVVYTEGVAYSGRLPYHQACASVLIMAPVTYLTTSSLLLRPILAEHLIGTSGEQPGRAASTMIDMGALRIPTTYKDANAIYVNPDFSNLESLIAFLRSHPKVARRIAQNQRVTMVGGGYLNLAAETCYWRALIRSWSRAAIVSGEAWKVLGERERYETWLLKQVSPKRERTRGKLDMI